MMIPLTTPDSRYRQIGRFAALFHCLLITGLFALGFAMPVRAGTASKPVRIVAFGDSLTAGFRLAPTDAFPAKLEKALRAGGLAVEIANAGVSGDTTAAGLARLDWAIGDGTDIVILEFGANDALRGIDPAVARANLDTLVKGIKAKGAAILIAGMLAPKNWGEDYSQRFDAIFPELAKIYGVALYPFFLDGIALKPELNLDDGLHPNPAGVDVIVERILPFVERLVKQQTVGSRQ
jgi:acyl-CoA thioesterase I